MAIVNSIRSAFRFLSLSRLVGATIRVEKFPVQLGLPGEMFDQLGSYFVDSLVVHASGEIEIGLSDFSNEHIGYFAFDKLVFSVSR